MIRRHAHLITQHDHARLAADLARHLGNAHFSLLDPMTIDAISLHDAGWPLHDDAPSLNDDGLPRDVFESTPAIALPVWTASTDRAESHHPYAGLLVSLHSLALSIFATARAPSTHESFSMADPHTRFSVNQFQHNEHERQKRLRQQLGLATDVPLTQGLAPPGTSAAEDLLRFHFRLLQAMDLCSLALCCPVPPADQTQDVQPHPGSPPIRLSLARPTPNHLTVDPWPFDQPRLDVTVPARRIDSAPFNSLPAFHAAYVAAAPETLTFLLTPAQTSSQ